MGRFEVHTQGGRWVVASVSGRVLTAHKTKRKAVERAAQMARGKRTDWEVRIRRTDGTIQEVREY